MTHAICALLGLGLAATAAAGSAAAERGPAPVAMSALAASAATQALPTLLRTARVFDHRWLAAMTLPVAAWHGAPVRAAGGLDAAIGTRFAATLPATNESRHVPAPALPARGRLVNASLASPSGGATQLVEAPFMAPGMRLTGTILPVPANAVERSTEPEPGTWAMLLAGLLGIGAIVRRRTAL